MARYDLELVRAAASGHWPECFASLSGLSIDLFDGKHHACPKPNCGGDDRFRLFDQSKGALICNQCFKRKNGDGFASVQWLLDCDFKTALEKVAEYFRIDPEKGKRVIDPASDLEFLPWNPTLAGLWCIKKKPIKAEAIKAIGGRLARYRKQFNVIAIPVSDQAAKAVGWIMYRSDGGLLPRFDAAGNVVEEVKVKLTRGSKKGIVGSLAGDVLWKVEGSTDLLSLISAGLPPGHSAFTTANGAQEKPLEWIIEGCKGKQVNVVHDADKPGFEGATWISESDGRRRPGWCPTLVGSARVVKHVQLPYEIQPTHGSDLRDYFGGGGTFATLAERADETEPFTIEPEDKAQLSFVDEADDDPHRLARVNLEKYRNAGRDLRIWRGEWYRYKGDRYIRISKSDLENRITASVKDELDRIWREKSKKDPDKTGTVRKVTSRLVADVIRATGGLAFLKSDQELNEWISEGPADCISMKNGILCLSELFSADPQEDRILLPHTPEWFSTSALEYDFDLNAECPSWLAFLDDVFNGDRQSILAIQKWFGYMLLPDTSLQKMVFVIGPPRSGKGTILRIMHSLFGKSSIATPTLNDFSDEFCLQGMVNKTIAIIADARLSRRADEIAITEKLLSITGEDPQDVRRKYMETLHGVRIPLRFTLFSNVLPNLSDSSAAFMTRCVFIRMPNTYVGREDRTLTDRLKTELPGILNWAIAGRYLLNQDGRIDQPESAMDLMREMKKKLSPVAMFFDEQCVGSGEVETKELFDAWCEWSKENDICQKMTTQQFGKAIRDVHNGISVSQEGSGFGKKRLYYGIGLAKGR